MLVPKTAMHEDNLAPANENKVWLTWQVTAVQPESISSLVSRLPYAKLWLHATAADGAHIGATAFC